ncbi:hypothetical protein [Embleya sp. NPDC005971]|uniref:hypothetical protein n=1 Tax=Embleya sp. NPDC005971 TaxID=3156724 RepID=UPI0033CDF07B
MLRDLALRWEDAGDREGAEHLLRRAADAAVLRDLVRMRERVGDRQGAEDLARQAVDAGDIAALGHLARVVASDRQPESEILRYGWEPDGSVSAPW